jgi:ABC-type transport system substrate-binding protein
MKWTSSLALLALLFPLHAAVALVWNNPHAQLTAEPILYGAMLGSPKTLDPARSYTAEENEILAQIDEPILQYHYLKRPYQLELLTAATMPIVTCLNKQRQPIQDCRQAYMTRYEISLKPHIYYQSHPAFVEKNRSMHTADLAKIKTLRDFENWGTRELVADDYVYQIKRLAAPWMQSPIYGVMSEHIIGFAEFAQQFSGAKEKVQDLRPYSLKGVYATDRYHWVIETKGYYPQFRYWLAMSFFVPTPWEADRFYHQPGLAEKNISMNTYPIGTGPYYLQDNDPNRQMILVKNPNFHEEYYPSTSKQKNNKQRLPFVSKVILSLDKESIPRWVKFLQGYYDRSGVSADSFDQAIRLNPRGQAVLTPELKAKKIGLSSSVEPSIYYLGFNLLDPIIGGYTEDKKKLRQAISIAINYPEYVAIFMNGRGELAQGPIPRGIFGYLSGEKGINPVVYQVKNHHVVRRPISDAKKLLAEAGYPNGIDLKTGKHLILNYDATTIGSPDEKAYFDWLRKQFKKIGIELNIRATLYNQFQDKIREGKVQLYSWGWSADYPDPENFMFLLYGPNSKALYGGENASNYQNLSADKLYEQIRDLPDGPKRQVFINQWLQIVRDDAPWVFGFNPSSLILKQAWVAPYQVNAMARNTLKYVNLNGPLRLKTLMKWNQPVQRAFWIILAVILLGLGLVYLAYWRREHQSVVRFYQANDHEENI